MYHHTITSKNSKSVEEKKIAKEIVLKQPPVSLKRLFYLLMILAVESGVNIIRV
jgi:hypothetical protein